VVVVDLSGQAVEYFFLCQVFLLVFFFFGFELRNLFAHVVEHDSHRFDVEFYVVWDFSWDKVGWLILEKRFV
jgi:hypothetical protein